MYQFEDGLDRFQIKPVGLISLCMASITFAEFQTAKILVMKAYFPPRHTSPKTKIRRKMIKFQAVPMAHSKLLNKRRKMILSYCWLVAPYENNGQTVAG